MIEKPVAGHSFGIRPGNRCQLVVPRKPGEMVPASFLIYDPEDLVLRLRERGRRNLTGTDGRLLPENVRKARSGKNQKYSYGYDRFAGHHFRLLRAECLTGKES
jgi:hypothetical protein